MNTTPTGRYQSAASWYDGAGRIIAAANYGTNGGSALSRPATVPARSDTVLVTETKYDSLTGRAFRTIDPAGKDHRTFFDALGRTTKTIANYTGSGTVSTSTPDQNVTVEMTYHPSGQIAALTAKNATTGDQITKYVYGTSKAWLSPLIYRNDLLTAEIYPDSDDSDSGSSLQSGSDGVVDRMEFQYNRAGEVMAKRDQNGSVHTYEYDNLGRLLHDRITTLGSGVDGAVRRISTVYDASGNVKSVTSYDNAAVNSGNVVNQVLYEYDANGLLAKDFSNPSGGVLASTPYTGYTYDTTKSGDQFTKRLRLTAMKYPGGKTLNYGYGTANSDGDKLNRLTEIKDGTTSVVQYVHEGVGTPIKITYPQPGLALDYTASGTLDRFGRIADHAWKKSTTDVVRIKHGYDRVGNRTYRNDSVQTSNSELYGYDGVNQIKLLNRGVLNSTNTSVTTSNFTESWNYDGTGNWLQYNRSGTVENRTHNKANEVQTSCTHDRNGNMTVMPGLKGKYDAWNRLVEVRNSSDSLIAAYAYNGLNQRVKKVVGSETRLFYFNQDWQCLEERVGSTVDLTYTWGSRYIDDLVCRDKGSERLYALADPNWNVVALTNASGTVQERMKYDAFGKVTWLDSAFTAKTNSGFAWNRTFTGQVLDAETGLMLYRNRYYHMGLGRFVSRDPIAYRARDASLYRYVSNVSISLLDPFGTEVTTKVYNETHTQTYTYYPIIRKPRTVYYRCWKYNVNVRIVHKSGCKTDVDPVSSPLEMTANISWLEALPTLGVSVFAVGITRSIWADIKYDPIEKACPNGRGVIVTPRFLVRSHVRYSVGFNPGLGPISFDVGWSSGETIQMNDFAIYLDSVECCECSRE